MKKAFFIIVAFVFFGCEQIEKIDKQMDADSTDIANEIADMRSGNAGALEKLANDGGALLYKAVGSEPGWYAEFYESKFRMLMNYGKDSIVLFREFKEGGDLNFTYNNTEEGNNIKLIVKIEDKECTDDAGGKNPNTVTVNFNDKVLKGCGMPVKSKI